MSDLQSETSETEQPTSKSESDNDKTDFWSKVSTAAYVVFVCWMIYQNVKDDSSFKLRLLFVTQKVLKDAALILGTAGLLVEKQYNDYVVSLH